VTVLLDPTGGRDAATASARAGPTGRLATRPPTRLASINGLTIALLDINKPRGAVFLDAVEERLREHGATTVRYRKPSYARVAPVDLRREIAGRCGAVIVALAD
jgi:hypothetical protein